MTPKKIIKLCSTSDLFNKKENIEKPNMSKRNSLLNNNISKLSNNSQFSIKNDMKNIETELYLNGTNSTKKDYINNNTKSNISNIYEGKQSRRKSSNIVGRINIKDEAKIKKLVKTNENSKKKSKKENELYLENLRK